VKEMGWTQLNLDESQTLAEERYCSKRKEAIFLKVRRMKVFQLV